jgi:hypothetical protein
MTVEELTSVGGAAHLSGLEILGDDGIEPPLAPRVAEAPHAVSSQG